MIKSSFLISIFFWNKQGLNMLNINKDKRNPIDHNSQVSISQYFFFFKKTSGCKCTT